MGALHNGKASAHAKRLLYAIVIIGITMIAEIVGGVLSNSLALLSDAGHMFTDFIALIISWVAYKIALKKSDLQRSYGYHRFQVVAAFINGLMLFVIAFFIIVEAVKRSVHPVDVDWKIMLIVSLIGMVANILAFFILHRRSESDLNIRSAVLHIIGDLLGSVAAVVASIVIKYTGWYVIDPILSVLVSLLILNGAYRVVCSSGHILLEGTPDGICPNKIKEHIISSVKDVVDADHIHAWSLTEGYPIITLNIKAASGANVNIVVSDVKKILNDNFGIAHATIEIEVVS